VSDHPHYRDTPKPGPALDDSTGTGTTADKALRLETVIEQARTTRRRLADDIARRLHRGERLSAEQLYDTLRAQTLATWWLLVDRHIRYAREEGGPTPERMVAKFAFWVGSCLTADAVGPAPDVALSVSALGPDVEHEIALAHFDRALALVRRDAARTFLGQVKTLAPASAQQTPSSSPTGPETTA
jgi:hypothetical protein